MTIGRPPIGPRFAIRLQPELLNAVNQYADRNQLSRTAAIRHLIRTGLGDDAPQPTTATKLDTNQGMTQ